MSEDLQGSLIPLTPPQAEASYPPQAEASNIRLPPPGGNQNLLFFNEKCNILDALEDYYDLKNKNSRVSQADIWLEFLRMYQHDCPSLAITIMLLLVIPASNAGIERMFSILKLMKPKNRSRMSVFVLRQRLRIASYFDVNNYDATKLYKKFHSLK